MSAVIWGMYNTDGTLSDQKGGTSGKGKSYGVSSEVWAYTERLSFLAQATKKEVFSGDGKVRFRHNFGLSYRIDGIFVPIQFYVVIQLLDMLVRDDPIQITDTDFGDIWCFLDTESREKIAGQTLPEAMRLHVTGWAYPNLMDKGIVDQALEIDTDKGVYQPATGLP